MLPPHPPEPCGPLGRLISPAPHTYRSQSSSPPSSSPSTSSSSSSSPSPSHHIITPRALATAMRMALEEIATEIHARSLPNFVLPLPKFAPRSRPNFVRSRPIFFPVAKVPFVTGIWPSAGTPGIQKKRKSLPKISGRGCSGQEAPEGPEVLQR
eukprot:7771165-Pyramimonas_sp.AAC.1